MSDNPEIGHMLPTCGYQTNCHDLGQGDAVMLLAIRFVPVGRARRG